MAIKLVINQVGLSTGRINVSRSDGLHTGGQVTFKHIGTGTASFELLWVPTDDVTAVSSFAQGDNACTFNPDVNSTGGTYRIKVTLVEGPSVTSLIRLFVVRTSSQSLRLLALNERANPEGSFENSGAGYIEESEFNEPALTGPFYRGNYGGWYSALTELFRKVEEMS